jgi:hypothetical protein
MLMNVLQAIILLSVATLNADAAAETTLPTLQVQTVAKPVATSRLFSTALGPNRRGGYNWIGQFMNYKFTTDKEKVRVDLGNGRHYLAYKDTSIRPEAEWVVLDLQTGKYRIFDWPGFHAGAACAAGNGRVFFSVDYGQIYYYEPTDETIKPLARIHEDLRVLRGFYRLQTGPDGMVYGSSQSTNGLASIIRINPDSLVPGRRAALGLRGGGARSMGTLVG